MASGVILGDGFDDVADVVNGPDPKWFSSSVNFINSGHSLNGQGKGAYMWGGSNLHAIFSTNYDHLVVAFKFKWDIQNNLSMLDFRCNNGVTRQLRLMRTSSGQLRVLNGSTELGRTPIMRLLAGVTYACQLRVKFDDSAGEVEILIDGDQLLNLTGQDTQENGATEADCDGLIFHNDGGGDGYRLDDVLIYDYSVAGVLHGDRLVKGEFPNGPGNYTTWTPTGAANNWDCVNEAGPDGDTTRVDSATPGDKDSYTITPHGVTTGSVLTVLSNMQAAKSDGALRQTRDFLRHGTTDANGTTRTLSATYQKWQSVFDDVPGGSGWSLAEAEAVEAGVECIA